jgi:hypothetical protein
MAEIRNEATLLVNTVIAVGLTLLISSLSFGLLTTIAGVILLLILYTYSHEARRTAGQSVAFAAVAALPFSVAAGMGIQKFAERKDLEIWLAVTWLCATVVGTAIDRARVNARSAQTVAQTTAPGSVFGGTVSAPPGYERAGQASSHHPMPASARTASASKDGIGITASAAPAQPIETTPPKPEASDSPSTPVEAAPATLEPDPTGLSAQEPVPPPSQARPAAETTIYINIIDQGISLLRSVRAEHIARDIYRIVEPKPEREIWRYEPGQTVRCRKQKLSFGRALVAFEEIILQRAN